MTITGREVDDDLFARLRRFYDDDALVELTAIIAWENSCQECCEAMTFWYEASGRLEERYALGTTRRRACVVHRRPSNLVRYATDTTHLDGRRIS